MIHERLSAEQGVYDFTMQVSTWFYTTEASFRTAEKKKEIDESGLSVVVLVSTFAAFIIASSMCRLVLRR